MSLDKFHKLVAIPAAVCTIGTAIVAVTIWAYRREAAAQGAAVEATSSHPSSSMPQPRAETPTSPGIQPQALELELEPKNLRFAIGEKEKQVSMRVIGPSSVLHWNHESRDDKLIPNRRLSLKSDGASAVLTVRPTPGLWGKGQVWVEVTDSRSSKASAFVPVTVDMPNLTIKAPEIVSAECGSLLLVQLEVSDESPLRSSLKLRLEGGEPLLDHSGTKTDNVKNELWLAIHKKARGEATVVVFAEAEDGRPAKTSFKLKTNPPPHKVGGKARVMHTIDASPEKWDAKVGVVEIPENTVVTIKEISGDRCGFQWKNGNRLFWLRESDLEALPGD